MDWAKFVEPANIIAIIAVVVGCIVSLLAIFIPIWRENARQQALISDFGLELFPSETIDHSTRYYIEPDCSIVDPSRETEIRNITRIGKTQLFESIDDFLSKESDYRHMIILADSGMGKTSALLNYYRYNKKKAKGKQRRIAVVPLGISHADKYIEKIEDKRNTVLCLDAFDEDTKAIVDYHERLVTLIKELGQDFSHIVLTTRTQFFPDDEEIPEETGIVRVAPRSGGEGRIYKFQKLYLMPLADKQVQRYLHKRYPLYDPWQMKTRRKARKLVEKVPKLSVRPMLLDFIPDLLEDNTEQSEALAPQNITHTFELYEALVEAWIAREDGIVEPNALRTLSKRLAVDIFVNREKRGQERISRAELLVLADEWGIDLPDWQITGRSLLNRDAKGNDKFAHRSIMEYLFLRAETTSMVIDWTDIELTDQMKIFIEEIITERRFDWLRTLPNADLSGDDLSGADLSGANLNSADLNSANLNGTDLSGADLSGTNLSGADLSGTNLSGTNLSRAIYSRGTRWPDGFDYKKSGAIGPNADLSRADLSGVDLSGADLIGAIYSRGTKWPNGFDNKKSGAIGPNADLSGADLSGADLSGADPRGTIYSRGTRWPNGFDYKKSGAIGPNADLSGADLSRADLSGADLRGADLSEADLRGADLCEADLSGADLRAADLRAADLRAADLRAADLREANLRFAGLRGADLSRAIYNMNTKWPNGFDYKKSGAIGPNADLREADLSGATYERWPDGFDYKNSGATDITR